MIKIIFWGFLWFIFGSSIDNLGLFEVFMKLESMWLADRHSRVEAYFLSIKWLTMFPHRHYLRMSQIELVFLKHLDVAFRSSACTKAVSRKFFAWWYRWRSSWWKLFHLVSVRWLPFWWGFLHHIICILDSTRGLFETKCRVRIRILSHLLIISC